MEAKKKKKRILVPGTNLGVRPESPPVTLSASGWGHCPTHVPRATPGFQGRSTVRQEGITSVSVVHVAVERELNVFTK